MNKELKKAFVNGFQYITNEMAKWVVEAPDFNHVDVDMKQTFKNFYDYIKNKIAEHNFDIMTATRSELRFLRFASWTSDEDVDTEIEAITQDDSLTDAYKQLEIEKLNNTRNLMLIPSWFAPLMPEGAEVVSISGDKHQWHYDQMQMGSREGVLAYGIVCRKLSQTR